MQLTAAGPGQQEGALVIELSDTGQAMTMFKAEFSLYMGGGECGQTGRGTVCGGEGMSFVYGALPAQAFGETGAGAGLRVAARGWGGRGGVL